jgi:REP element-mobilizing transposase RayT
MPRPPRTDFPDAVYHVTSRGNGRADIFHSDEDRQRFLAQLAEHLHQCAVVLYAYTLMDNHVHLLVRTPRANLSRFMQRLLSSYALYWRYRHRRPGHLFQGRFKAKLVEDEVYLLAVTRYIHLNAVKIAACRRMDPRERLDRLNAYPWSSYAGYCAAAKAEEFVTYDVLKEYGRHLPAARRHYRGYVQACLLEDDRPLLEAMAASRYAIGGTAFIARTEERIEQRRSGRVRDRDLDLPRRSVSLEEIDRAVGGHYRLDPSLLSAHGRRVGPAKSAAVELAARLADMTGRAIGEHYGIGATGVAATHRRLADQPGVLQVVETLARELQKQKRKCKVPV